jgi:hypothetical protein
MSQPDVTAFVTTIGDVTNFNECLAHLSTQTSSFKIDIIDHVAPMSAAFQAMHERCTTPLYVQVDEDMLLVPTAIERLVDIIRATEPNVAWVCAPLWDCEMDAPTYGISIYRTAIVKRFDYRNAFATDRAHAQDLFRAGFDTFAVPFESREACFGLHGKHYTPRSIYARWQRLVFKARRFGDMSFLDAQPARLAEKYAKNPSDIRLFALLGAVSGIIGQMPSDTEKDWREPPPYWTELSGYFHATQLPSSILPATHMASPCGPVETAQYE